LGLKLLLSILFAKSFIPLTFCLLKPQLFNLLNDSLLTVLALILFLHFFLNRKKTEFAAATLICCPMILLQSEKKTSFLVVKIFPMEIYIY
jgi:type IV secretory pathway TrbL component